MGKNSKIEWTHHTFNPWWGCVKVSPACKHCYAEAWAKRTGNDVWGHNAPRRFLSDRHWKEPLKWPPGRVFCASMADVFEDREDLDPSRQRLWALIEQTPNLDWLLLTKRPECIDKTTVWPPNVWMGVTAENQEYASLRIPLLLETNATTRFLSCEPLLGPLNLSPWLDKGIDWVIAGGESGAKARPTNPEWFRSLRDQCVNAGVPFFFKQWGQWSSDGSPVGKNRAGRILDGETWDQIPRT
jgi:protein gp37